METISPSAVRQLKALIEEAVDEDNELKAALENLRQEYPDQMLERFLRARDGNVAKAFRMLVDCLHWRFSNDIDNILSKPIQPKETYNTLRESQLIGMTGFCKQGRPVFALGVGLSGYDKAPLDKYVQSHIQINEYRDRVLLPSSSKKNGHYIGTCLKILDMSSLKLSALSRLKILTIISTVDDLNYPEKTDTYYIVNAPYIFSACWKVVKPLLQERTKRKIKVLQGSGKEELLQVMDYDVLPFFCQNEPKQGGSSRGSSNGGTVDCYSSSHPFHMELWNYMKQQSYKSNKCVGPMPQKSFHVAVPELDAEAQSIGSAIATVLVQLEDNEVNGNGKVLNGILDLSLGKD